MKKILIVEDDHAMSVALQASFTREGFHCEMAWNGADGLRRAMQRRADAVLLDVMLPGLNGRDICQQLRASWPEVPILMITALGHELDIVAALRMGADDYVVKPFEFSELLARVEAVMRRRPSLSGRAAEVRFGDVWMNLETREVWRNAQPLPLTPRDFDILTYFARHPGQLVTRAELAAILDGGKREMTLRLVDTYVWRLRQSLEEDPAEPRLLITVHGRGYRLEAARSGESD